MSSFTVNTRTRALGLATVAALAATWGVVATATPSTAIDATVSDAIEFYDAIDAANGSADAEHVITLDSDFTWTTSWVSYTGTGNITLDGAGHTVTLSDTAVGFFDVYDDDALVEVTIRDLTLTGDAIQSVINVNAGDLYMDDVDISGFTTEWAPLVWRGESATIENSTFVGNTATSGDGGAVVIYADSAEYASIHGSTFTGNQALDGDGGAISSDSSLEIAQSVFSDNVAAESGGAVAVQWEDARVDSSIFSNNEAAEDGGAIWANDGNSYSAASTYSGNYALGDGGALWTASYSDTNSVTFNGNYAGGDGGAIYADSDDYSYLGNSTFDDNEADGYGGAVHAQDGFLDIFHSTFTANVAGIAGAHAFVANDDLFSYASVFDGALGTAGCGATGDVDSRGYNFDDDGFCTDDWESTGDFGNGADPGLGALADNEGPTYTRMPTQGSVLVDAIPPTDCLDAIDAFDSPEFDQRGVSRDMVLDNGDEGCDTGSVEVIPDTVIEYYNDAAQLIATATITNAMGWECGDTYTLAELGGTPPAGVSFPYGGFDFCITLPDAGWPTSVTWVFPAPVNQMWKIDEGVWSKIDSAVISGNTVSYTIVDGDSLDTDGAADGFIDDPAAAGVGAAFTG